MPENLKNISIYNQIGESGNAIRILLCRYEREVWPWRQKNCLVPYWKLYYQKSPGAKLHYRGKPMPLEKGKFYLIPRFTQYDIEAEQPFDQFFIHFDLAAETPLIDDILTLDAEPVTLELIDRFIAGEKDLANLQNITFIASAIVSLVLLKLPEKFFRLPEKVDARIAAAIQQIEYHLERNFSNAELAEIAGMSRNSFIRLFSREMRESPQQFMRRRKISESCKMLAATELSIDEIAENLGFANRFHFSRIFRRVMNDPPALFRRQATMRDLATYHRYYARY